MKKLTRWVLALVFISLTFAAEAQSQSQLEQDLENLRAWMRKKSSQADSITRAEWPNVKREYRELTANLDRNSSKLSDKSKQEYNEVKGEYNELEDRNEAVAVELDGRKLERWEREMAGTANIARIKAANLRDAYIHMMEYTREKRRNWTPADWEYAEFVYGELNNRKAQVVNKLPNGDKIKIAALQVEFETLRKTRSR